MMTLPKLTNSLPPDGNRLSKSGSGYLSSSDWLLQDSKSKFSSSSATPPSSGTSLEASLPKMSTVSSSSYYAKVGMRTAIIGKFTWNSFQGYFSSKRNATQ